ncbi:ABC transporter ATP-binding protein [Clostridium sp. YIM B02551]|uniref:ABC transporter ATP-binding protein n=1 Tax=Clostridium sp. YIM B02551 TaxID=2910679 RepID=UPI001EEA02B0|nr:ABC transporter ATP-binding protein [Clostridium sp. YIM B02551]
MNEVVLKTHNLTKRYGDQYALNNVNMTIEKGQIYGFIGQNGAGKTTLIRLITGLIHKTSGEVELLPEASDNNIEEARKITGSLVESPAFYPNMTARENLEVSRLVRNIAGKESIDEVLEHVGLKDAGKKKFKNFSLGMKQRLGIANALLGNPKFLILDEPINGLDPVSIVEIRELLKKVNKEKDVTILISSHILSELSELATHYGIIDKGNLIEEISAKDLREKCKQYIEIQVSDPKKSVVLLEKEFDITDYMVYPNNLVKVYSHLDFVGKINTLLSVNGIIVDKIGLKGQNLEEYFINTIGGVRND